MVSFLLAMAFESFRPTRLSETFQNSFLSLTDDFADGVERLQDLGVALEPQGAQENRAVKFAFAVDTDVQQILVVVLELHPASPIRNDLAEKIALCRHALEEYAGRAVQLRNDDALGPVDDEGAVVGHQRNFTEEDLLLLDVADRLGAGFGVLVINRQPDGYLERRRVGHAALFALGHVVFQLQPDRIAAAIAEGDDILVERSAAVAQHVADMERIGLDGGAAAWIAARGTQVMQPFQVAALALPVSDRIVDELQLAQAPEVGNRKNRVEHALQAGVFPLAGKQVHLQKPLI